MTDVTLRRSHGPSTWLVAGTHLHVSRSPGHGYIVVSSDRATHEWMRQSGLTADGVATFHTLRELRATISSLIALDEPPPLKATPKLISAGRGRYRTADGSWTLTRNPGPGRPRWDLAGPGGRYLTRTLPAAADIIAALEHHDRAATS